MPNNRALTNHDISRKATSMTLLKVLRSRHPAIRLAMQSA